MAELTTHTGGCHCGSVRYEAKTDLGQVISCNCSICQKRGALLTFVPVSSFDLRSGAESLSDYQFNRKVIHHLFCTTCGVSSFARGTRPDGTQMIAINVRCLDGVDLDALTITPFDGKSL
jgi:hypothetical protein